MKKHTISEQIPALALLLIVSVYFFIKAFSYGDVKLFPLITSSITIVCSVICLLKAIRATKEINKRIDSDDEFVAEISAKKLVVPIVGYAFIAAYAILIPIIGFFTSTGIFMLAMMFYLGYRKWHVMILVTAGIELGIYVLFVEQLMVRIPHGILF